MGALYYLKQKLVDFANVIQTNENRTDTVPRSAVVYSRIATAPQFVKGTYTGAGTKTTFTFLNLGGARRPWLIFGNGRLAIREFTNSLTNFQFTVVVGSTLTATSVGENKVEVAGFEYYDNPIAISLRN